METQKQQHMQRGIYLSGVVEYKSSSSVFRRTSSCKSTKVKLEQKSGQNFRVVPLNWYNKIPVNMYQNDQTKYSILRQTWSNFQSVLNLGIDWTKMQMVMDLSTSNSSTVVVYPRKEDNQLQEYN